MNRLKSHLNNMSVDEVLKMYDYIEYDECNYFVENGIIYIEV